MVLLEQGLASLDLRRGQQVAVLEQPEPAAQSYTDQHAGTEIDPGQQGQWLASPICCAQVGAHVCLVMASLRGSQGSDPFDCGSHSYP